MSKPVPCLLYLFDMSASDFSRGNEFLRNGQLEEAIAAYQKAIGQIPPLAPTIKIFNQLSPFS
ncbi:tetratricopeptide repeat protein, partial [Limnospira sp. PMC 737.11]|uniref:tetratricopeptide repeat protein n=1 Tax=Limnospira sp. PMC 737.11 TaxID=2981095 RepID=UPI0028E956CD